MCFTSGQCADHQMIKDLKDQLKAVRDLLWRDHDEGGEFDKTLRDLRKLVPRG